MGQLEVIKILEKMKIPISSKEIAEILNENKYKISKILNSLIKQKCVRIVEIDKDKAYEEYGCKHRMRLYCI